MLSDHAKWFVTREKNSRKKKIITPKIVPNKTSLFKEKIISQYSNSRIIANNKKWFEPTNQMNKNETMFNTSNIQLLTFDASETKNVIRPDVNRVMSPSTKLTAQGSG